MTETNPATTAPPAMSRSETFVIALALTAAALRLIPLQWLHPLNWDELEFFRATSWIADGRVPFRDFWEHHTPLTWFLFAPIAALIKSPGVDAIVVLRWAQIPVWIATFWLVNLWMRHYGVERFARWSAMAVVLASSLFMIPAVEYRVEAVAIAFLFGALVLLQRERFFLAGVLLCASVLANLRFGPMVAVAVLVYLIALPEEGVWRFRPKALGLVGGGLAALIAALLYFVFTGSLGDLYQQVWVDNLAEKYAAPVIGGFVHRLLVPFGVRLLASERPFELAAVDMGGVAVLLIGAVGLFRGLGRWRAPDHRFVLAFLLGTNLLFVAAMKFVYNYHFLLVAVMAIPLVAMVFNRASGRRGGRSAILIVLLAAWCVNAFASVFRGKELDRAYQDLVMRETHARVEPGERFWGGMPWALQREPSYRFWFLPELARRLVAENLAGPYALSDLASDPPAAVVFDHNALVWVVNIQRELAPYFVRHYVPVWRNLWVPGMNARLGAGGPPYEWVVPRSGEYRIYGSPDLTSHLWFRNPLLFVMQKGEEAARSTLELGTLDQRLDLQWWLDGQEVGAGEVLSVEKGQRVSVVNRGSDPVAVILYAGADRVLFRQPPPGVTLEGETARITHWPRFGAKIE